MSEPILVREATADDIPEILRHRRAMFEDMSVGDPASLGQMVALAESYLRETIALRHYRGWFAITPAGEIAGGIGVLIQSSPPRPWDLRSQRPYLLNLYVYPARRRQGIARLLVQTSLDWCRSEGFVVVSLHASEFGRPLYESLGFESTNEMRLKFG